MEPGQTDAAPESPRWGSTTKLVVSLTIVAGVAALVIQFRGFIGPLILAFLLAYLLLPVAERLRHSARLPWRSAVTLLYLVLLLLLGGGFTVTGLAIAQQVVSLNTFVQEFITSLPDLAANLAKLSFTIGPFSLSLGTFDLPALGEQLLAQLQPLLGRIGGLVTTFAAGAAGTVGWVLFILLISYFLLAEAGRFQAELVHIELPGYSGDIRNLSSRLQRIWNSFFRGQLIIFFVYILLYASLFTVFGLRYAVAIALLAGVGKFVPYLGSLSVYVVTAAVGFFQGGNYLGLEQVAYTILVTVLAILLDNIIDNLISPRIMSDTLGVHPAAVLLSAIILANLIGFIGLIVAAPVLATLTLVGRYTLRKLLDLDPWVVEESPRRDPTEQPLTRLRRRLVSAWRALRRTRAK